MAGTPRRPAPRCGRVRAAWLTLVPLLAMTAIGAEPAPPVRRASLALPSADAKVSPRERAVRFLEQACRLTEQSAELEEKGNCRAIDGYFTAAEAAWNAVWICPGDPTILPEAAERYATALEGLLRCATAHGRLDGRGLLVGPDWGPIVVPIETPGMPIRAAAIERIVADPPPADRRVSRHHQRGGFGLPVSVRVTRDIGSGAATDAFPGPARAAGPTPGLTRSQGQDPCLDRTRGQDPSRAGTRGQDPSRAGTRGQDPSRAGTRGQAATPPRQSLAATAVLRFTMPADENVVEAFVGPLARDHAPAILDLVDPMEIAAVDIGPARPLLAADLTAPLLDMLEGMPKDDFIAGFLRPYGRADTRPRLQLLEPHRPGRVPVVFIHGLGSDEGTWYDLLNELRTRPWFHRRFEPWVYQYPTGASFMESSRQLRVQLAATVRRLDPDARDPAMQNLVLVGHSMGGLHAKLQVVDSGTALWDAMAQVPFEQVRLRPALKRYVAASYFVKPVPFVKRVVYIATPHGGSSLASLAVGRFASATIRQPPATVALHREIVTTNPGVVRPEYEKALPTTIDILEPDSSVLQALYRLRPPCWVSQHSIIGDVWTSPVSGPGDKVVPTSSARLPGVVSEVVVPAAHTKVHHHPITVLEMERILGEHLRECGL